MPQYRLSFRVDPADAIGQDDFRRDLYRRFGLKLFSMAWAEIELPGWPRLAELITALEDLQRRSVARLGSGVLVEVPLDGEIDASEWFILRSEPYADFEIEPYPSIRADRVPPGRHILDDGRFVSERFKAAVEAAGLSDIEFLLMEDTGKFRAPQWYVPIAGRCLGRGLDHPWFDRAHAQAQLEQAKIRPYELAAQGISRFDGRNLKTGWSTGDVAVDRLLSMFPTGSALGLMIQMLPRFERADLPAADVAYNWEWDIETADCPRLRRLCVSTRARRILLDAGVITPAETAVAIVVDHPTSGRIESADAWPPPVYTASELAGLRKEEPSRKAILLRREKPERRPTLARSLALLRTAKKRRTSTFGKPARLPRIERAAAELGVTFPADWIDVLKVADGGDFGRRDVDCQIVPLDELPQFHREHVEHGRKVDDDYPEGFLSIGVNATGDYFALDLEAPRSAREGIVVLFSHETLQIERRWDTVAAFLDSILSE